MSDVKETGFFINTVKQTPAKAGISMITEDTPGPWCFYEVKLDDEKKIHFYLDPFSRVDFDPVVYQDLAPYTNTPSEAFAVVTLENAFSRNDLFHGYVTLEHVSTYGCSLDHATIECRYEDSHETYGLKSALVSNSQVINSETPPGILITDRTYLNETVIRANGLAIIKDSRLELTWLETKEGNLSVTKSTLEECNIKAAGSIFINHNTLRKVELDTMEELTLYNPFCFFYMDFGGGGFNFYQAAKGSYMVGINGSGWELNVTDPDFSEMLHKQTKFWPTNFNITSAIEHLIDSVKSRVKVLEMLATKQEQ